MKRIIVPVIFLIGLSIILFVVFTKASINMTYEEALKIGEEKYLKFLWMVDGAFNSERMNGDFTVNGKILDEKDKLFTCKYQKKNKNECIGNNFEEEFLSLFSSKLKYDNIYSDGNIYKWYKYEHGKYIFNNINNCSVNRMELNHQMKVNMINKDEILFVVGFNNDQMKYESEKEFILVLEDNEWKISKAFYHDLCGMKYYIE